MDLLKQLNEAKAQGLSKEEFFRLLDAEIKLSEHKQQTSTGSDKGFDAGSADVSKQLAIFLQDVDERLKTLEQQQSARLNEYMREQQQQLQQFQQQHQQHFQLFQQQQQQQLQHLQQQQERQHVEHIQHLQQQQQQMPTQVQQFQKQMKTVQTQPSHLGGEASDFSKEHRKEKQNFDTALSQVKENFHEMRNTVLNRLEEEKIYMRDELSKAQHELKADLSKVAANVTEIKDKLQVIDLVKMRDNVGQIRQCYEKLARNIQEKDSGKLERKKILDRVNAAQGNVQQTIRKMVQELKDAITIHVTELKESADENALKLQDHLEDVKTDIVAVSDNEYQLLKNCLNHEGKPPEPRKTYVGDLNVTNFEKFVNTEETLDSLPWYIDQFHSCIKGSVCFTEEGDMEAWVIYGRNPRRVGLPPQSDISAKVKASVVDLTGNKEPLFIAEELWDFNEDEIPDDSGGWGIEVGSIKCAQVIDMGLVNDDGTILIRFEVEML